MLVYIPLFFLTDPFAAAWCHTLTVDYILFYIILYTYYIILYTYYIILYPYYTYIYIYMHIYIYIYMHIYIYIYTCNCISYFWLPSQCFHLFGIYTSLYYTSHFLGGNLTCQSNFLAGVPLALRPAIYGATDETISG